MERFVRVDGALIGAEFFHRDEVFEFREDEFQLTGNGNHDAVNAFFDQSAVSAGSQLAAENDVESGRTMAADFVSELQTGELDLLANALVDDVRDNASET